MCFPFYIGTSFLLGLHLDRLVETIERGIIGRLQKRETDYVKNYIFNPGVKDLLWLSYIYTTNLLTF